MVYYHKLWAMMEQKHITQKQLMERTGVYWKSRDTATQKYRLYAAWGDYYTDYYANASECEVVAGGTSCILADGWCHNK